MMPVGRFFIPIDNLNSSSTELPITLTAYQSQVFAWELTRRASSDSIESLGSTLADAQVDLNPHRVEAALFVCQNPLLVADYLRRPDLKALPNSQRQLITLVLWKLLASSTHAIGGALGTMATRLEKILEKSGSASNLAEVLDQDYEALDEEADEWEAEPKEGQLDKNDQNAISAEIIELRRYETMATNIRDNAKGQALLTALERAFAELGRLGAPRKALILQNRAAPRIIFSHCSRILPMVMGLCFSTAPTLTRMPSVSTRHGW